jgi:RND family efflux transporter MFP subunit
MLRTILEHKITLFVAGLVCVIVAAGAAYFLLSPQKRALTAATAQVMAIQEKVSADGQIDSDQHVSLSFKGNGLVQTVSIKSVNVKVGDPVYAGETLAVSDPGTLSASLQGAEADVLSAQANVTALQKGATTQTVAVYDQGVSTASLALAAAVRDSYLKIEDALLNKINVLFQNSTSANPTLVIPTDSSQTGLEINNARVDMTTRMSDWNSLMNASATSDNALTEATADIAAIKSFVDSLSTAADRLSVGNSGMAQSSIDADVDAVNAAATEVNGAETEFDSALQAYKTSTDQLNVIQASSTPETLEMAEAGLAKAQANVASIESQLSDTILTAPFDGVVASVNLKAGDDFPAGSPAIDVVNAGAYKIDIMVPENEVAAIKIGDEADIGFDASGGLSATGTVSSIDLSETMVNGVGAYKTTVYLNGSNPNIRTGMSATVTIKGVSVQNIVAIPSSAIITKNDGSYALVLDAKGNFDERKIETGISDGNWTEVTSGINEGENIAAFGENNQ